MIKLENVYMAFTKNYYTLYDINLEVKKGEKVAVLGEQDSGKTCLLRVMLGLDKPLKGSVMLNGIKAAKINFKKDINALYISSQGVFLENNSLYKNLEYILKERNEKTISSDITIMAALKNFGLFGYKDELPKNLNKFNRVMLALARASLRSKIDLLVVDDIFVDLSHSERQHVIKHLTNYFKNENLTIVLALNEEELINDFNFRKIKLNLGALTNAD